MSVRLKSVIATDFTVSREEAPIARPTGTKFGKKRKISPKKV